MAGPSRKSTRKAKIRDFLIDLDALLALTLIISKGLLVMVAAGDIVNVVTLIAVAGLIVLAELFFKGLLRIRSKENILMHKFLSCYALRMRLRGLYLIQY